MKKPRYNIRDTEHKRSAALLGNETSELLLGLIDGLLVLFTNFWVVLRHFSFSDSATAKKTLLIAIENRKIKGKKHSARFRSTTIFLTFLGS